MQEYQYTFLQFALEIGALQFGEFTLKSGRKSPYFFNTGQFNTGASIARLGRAYADAIIASGIKFDMLYGPAYKGIPIIVATSIALMENYQMDAPYAFNRKEVKDHGEGGMIVGNLLCGRVLILDDVISAGTSIRESVNLIREYNATPVGIAIALDRQEYDANQLSNAVMNLDDSNLSFISILQFSNLIEFLTQSLYNIEMKAVESAVMAVNLQRMRAYQAQYGTL